MEYRLLVLGASHPDDAICIRPGLQSWATYGVDLDIARLRVVVAAARRYYGHLRSAGLAKEPEQVVTALPSTPALTPEIQDRQDDLDSLTVYNRESLTYQGLQDRARRAWLKQWAEQHNYPAYWFTLYDKYSGFYQAGVPAGTEGWSGFLEKATHYDIYCCFVAALERHPLKHHLEDARWRGEIKRESDGLLWRPT